jgi:sugar/nucleoside kinase (ribokinase family)
MSSKQRFDILGLGCVAVDDIIYIKSYPPVDTKIPVLRRKREIGGLTARAILAATGLGAKCAYSAVLGHDDLSEYVISTLQSSGIDIEYIKKNKVAGPIYSMAVVAEKESSRNVYFDDNRWKKGVINVSPPSGLIRSSRILLLDNYIGIPSAIRAAEIARDFSIPIVADLEDNCDKNFNQLMNLVDHLIIASSFAQKITGFSDPELAIEKIWDKNKKFICITNGQDGCYYRSSGDSAMHHQPAFTVPVIDTTGCGDVFHGAYAVSLKNNISVKTRVKFASAAAAIKAQGVFPPNKAAVLKLMGDYNRKV